MRVFLRRIGRYGLYAVLIVLSLAITYIHILYFPYGFIYTNTKVSLATALTIMCAKMPDYSFQNMFASYEAVSVPDYIPEHTTTVYADGFAITVPLELTFDEEKSAEYFYLYHASNGLRFSYQQSHQDTVVNTYGETIIESALSALKAKPYDFLLARSPISLTKAYIDLGFKSSMNTLYYVRGGMRMSSMQNMRDRFGDHRSLAQQYLFHSLRLKAMG